MRRIIVLLFVVALIASAQSKPNFSGEWKLNTAKSSFGEMPPPDSMSSKIEHKDAAFKSTTQQSSQNGDFTLEMSCTIDGPECSYGGGPLKMKALLKWDADAITVESKGKFNEEFEFEAKDRWTLSSDGKVLTMKRHFSSQMGEMDQTLVLEKQ
jgi:hypothetical protein